MKPYHPRLYLHSAFRFGMEADFDGLRPPRAVRYDIGANPVSRIPKPPPGAPRERCLSIDELRAVYNGVGAGTSITMSLFIRGLIGLGGLRVEEVENTTRNDLVEIDWRLWWTKQKTKMDQPTQCQFRGGRYQSLSKRFLSCLRLNTFARRCEILKSQSTRTLFGSLCADGAPQRVT